MKLQNLVIIFIIIIIPIVLIFSLYLNLETKTISLQTNYDEKLIEATKEAIEAFEINTTEWNSGYSTLANSKRRDIMSSINAFTSGLADKLGIGATSKESILTYIPAIVYIMYDGYYIYSPTYVPETHTNENGVQLFYYENASAATKVTTSATQNIGGTIVAGEPMYVCESGTGKTQTYNGKRIIFTTNVSDAKKTYKHVLKTFVPYTTTYDDYVINYTLDNYVRIYGENESREGYIIDANKITLTANNISVKFDGNDITAQNLTENIAVRNNTTGNMEVNSYSYVYNSNNDKRYYDSSSNKFFTLNNNYEKVPLPDTGVGTSLAEYKKIVICTNTNNGEYLELYQLLNTSNGVVNNNWYKWNSESNQFTQYTTSFSINRRYDCSAINYYVETYCFNKWLEKNTDIEPSDIMANKTQSIINNINNNLNLSISNYSANSKIEYKLPEISDEDWEQALSNISVISFFQGIRIGLKTYNNYTVVTSTENNEYVSEESLYFESISDNYEYEEYHRYGCDAISNIASAYKNTDFKVQSYEEDDTTKYYYKHKTILQCYDCIVNRNNFDENITNSYKQVFYTSLARERYIQMQKTKLTQ